MPLNLRSDWTLYGAVGALALVAIGLVVLPILLARPASPALPFNPSAPVVGPGQPNQPGQPNNPGPLTSPPQFVAAGARVTWYSWLGTDARCAADRHGRVGRP